MFRPPAVPYAVHVDAPVERRGPLQSGFSQFEWLSYQLTGREFFLHQCGRLDIPRDIPDALLRRAIDLVVSRHEVLRTTYGSTPEGDPQQIVAAPAPTPIARYEPELGISEPDYTMAMDKKPFRVGEEWPLRVARIGDQLRLVVAHIAVDGTAAQILADEVTVVVHALAEGREPELPPVRWQPVDQARWEQSPDGRRVAASALAFWQAELAERPLGFFPVAVLPPVSSYVEFVVRSPAAGLALKRAAAAHSSSLAAVFTAAAAMVFGYAYGQDVIPFNMTWAARDRAGVREMVGAVFRDVVFCIDLAGDPPGSPAGMAAATGLAFKRILRAGMRARFDVAGFADAETRVSVERGACPRPGLFVNVRPFEDLPGPLTESSYEELCERTTVTTDRLPRQPRRNADVFLQLTPTKEGAVFYAVVNESLLSAKAAEELLRGIETVLVEFELRGDLTLDEAAELLPTIARTEPDASWAYVDRTWVSVPATEDLLVSHPDVEVVRVRTGEAGLVADITTRNVSLRPVDLRRHLLSRIDRHTAAICPAHFDIRTGDGELVAAGAGTEPVDLPPADDRERALLRAVVAANGIPEPSMAENYVVAGGSLLRVPRVVRLLAASGFAGLALEDFRRPTDLADLARRLVAAG